MDTVASTLDSPGLSTRGVTVSAVMVPLDEVDVPLTKVSGSAGEAGVRSVRVTESVSNVFCEMHASNTFLTWMQTFSQSPFIGLPLMFPGHLSADLELQKDIFLPPFLLLL